MHFIPTKQNDDARKRLRLVFFLNFGFTILEAVGGVMTNSMAILSDALHDMGDSLTLGVAWYLHHKSGRGGDNKFSFGYQRFSLLGALFSGMVLIFGSLFIFANNIPRLFNPEPASGEGMVLLAVLGIVVNGFAAFFLSKGNSLNEKLVSWHLIEDVLGWVAVLIVGGLFLFTDWYILDPLLSILITCYVLFNVLRHTRKTVRIFMQGVPETVHIPSLEHKLMTVENVKSVHDLQVWSLDGIDHVMSVHLVVSPSLSVKQIFNIKQSVRGMLRKIPISHTTIEIEFEDEDCNNELAGVETHAHHTHNH